MSVIFDLDGTLADTRHRRPFLPFNPQGPADWIDYHSHCPDDPPIAGRIALARLLAEHHDIVIITARPATTIVMERTATWLAEHAVPYASIEFMPLTEVSVHDWKARVVDELQMTDPVVLAVDDWWQNGDALEAIGIPVVHVTPPGIGRVGEQVSPLVRPGAPA